MRIALPTCLEIVLNIAPSQVATVVVSFPATPLVMSRARFCISAAHTREDLDYALAVIDAVCGKLCIRYGGKGGMKQRKLTVF